MLLFIPNVHSDYILLLHIYRYIYRVIPNKMGHLILKSHKSKYLIQPIKRTPPLLISRIHNYCNLNSVEQLKSVTICYQLAPLFSCSTPNDTTSVKQLSYCLEKQMLLYAYKNRFLYIFPWPSFFQAYYMLIR